MKIDEGKEYKVTIRQGQLGCSDAQDACDEYGFLVLYKKGDNYKIDTPEGDNIIMVDDINYIESIIAHIE